MRLLLDVEANEECVISVCKRPLRHSWVRQGAIHLKKLSNIFRKIKSTIWKKFHSPVDYARRIGVNFGEGLHIYGDVHWSTEPWIITLGKNCHITDGVRFLTHDGGVLLFRDRVPDLELTRPITIGDNVYIGTSSIIMGGVSIGNDVIIGAGSIVTRDIPSNSLVVGTPARVIKTADDYFEKAQRESLHCGNLHGEQKDRRLKEIYGYVGSSRGIYEF